MYVYIRIFYLLGGEMPQCSCARPSPGRAFSGRTRKGGFSMPNLPTKIIIHAKIA